MFDFFRRHMKVLQFVLILLVFPSFVFFGIEGYSRYQGGEADAVAKVDGQDITRIEWDNALREQIDRARQQMPNVDAKLFETPEARRLSLDALVRERVMLAAAQKEHLVTTDDRLRRLFTTDPQFAVIRNPDGSVNREALAAQGMSSEGFAQRLRQELSQRQVMLGLAGTVIAPVSATDAALDAMFQQREVQVQRFDAKDYLAKVSPSQADLEKYYAANAAQFQSPEHETINYVVLDIEALKKDITVSDDELRKYYTENEQHYATPEERRASHILIKADKGEPAAERAKAKAKAEAILAELRKNPGEFAALARKDSDDTGSAEKGGDLGFFARGAMVKPFEDAAFSLKVGEISNLIESDFGYHIIEVTAVRGGEKRSFDAVRPELEREVRAQLAQKRFADASNEFSNMVYEQPDSLKPVAEKFKLPLQTAQNVTRTPAPGATGPLGNPKFLEALFGTEAIRNKRNTEAIETGPSQLVSGHVLQHVAAHQMPLAEVIDQVRVKVKALQAAELARKAGSERLAALQATPPGASLDSALQKVSRAQPRELPRPLLDAILTAPATNLPTTIGVDLGSQGYAVAKIIKVDGRDPVAADAPTVRSQYAQALAAAEAEAYYDALKQRFKVQILPAATAAVKAASAPD